MSCGVRVEKKKKKRESDCLRRRNNFFKWSLTFDEGDANRRNSTNRV